MNRTNKDSLTVAAPVCRGLAVLLCVFALAGCSSLLDARGPARLNAALYDGDTTATLAFSGPWGYAVEQGATIRSETVTGPDGTTTHTLTVGYQTDAKEANSLYSNLGSAAIGLAAGALVP